jgi:FxsC-like protein
MASPPQSAPADRKLFRFFFSYSWKNRGEPLKRFFKDLTEQVRKLVGGTADYVAFRDRITMESGTDWPAGILDAMATSQVLVYLLSSDYIQSEFCGKELQAFLERVAEFKTLNKDAPTPLFIQPVIWVPLITADLPQPLGRIQPEDDAFPADYAKRGLESLAKRRDKTAYNSVVETLAYRIVTAAAGDRLPILTKYTSHEQIPNAFVAQEPARPPEPEIGPQRETGVRCVYVAPKGWHWQPYHPPEQMKIGSLVQQLLTNLHYREVVLEDEDDPGLTMDAVVAKLEAAAKNDQIVLLIVDARAAGVYPYQEFLQKFNEKVPINNAVVIPWKDGVIDDAELRMKLEQNLRYLFKSKYFGLQPLPFFKPRITSVDEFRNVVPGLLETMRVTIDTSRAAQKIIESSRTAPQVRSSRDQPA